eukprot:UC1_evm1s872
MVDYVDSETGKRRGWLTVRAAAAPPPRLRQPLEHIPSPRHTVTARSHGKSPGGGAGTRASDTDLGNDYDCSLAGPLPCTSACTEPFTGDGETSGTLLVRLVRAPWSVLHASIAHLEIAVGQAMSTLGHSGSGDSGDSGDAQLSRCCTSTSEKAKKILAKIVLARPEEMPSLLPQLPLLKRPTPLPPAL